uniref:Uncharacterized protein n=1 Tax=Palpitomonas bilix TaxID=652834 RepID=A0A7S3GDU0_9EUKA
MRELHAKAVEVAVKMLDDAELVRQRKVNESLEAAVHSRRTLLRSLKDMKAACGNGGQENFFASLRMFDDIMERMEKTELDNQLQADHSRCLEDRKQLQHFFEAIARVLHEHIASKRQDRVPSTTDIRDLLLPLLKARQEQETSALELLEESESTKRRELERILDEQVTLLPGVRDEKREYLESLDSFAKKYHHSSMQSSQLLVEGEPGTSAGIAALLTLVGKEEETHFGDILVSLKSIENTCDSKQFRQTGDYVGVGRKVSFEQRDAFLRNVRDDDSRCVRECAPLLPPPSIESEQERQQPVHLQLQQHVELTMEHFRSDTTNTTDVVPLETATSGHGEDDLLTRLETIRKRCASAFEAANGASKRRGKSLIDGMSPIVNDIVELVTKAFVEKEDKLRSLIAGIEYFFFAEINDPVYSIPRPKKGKPSSRIVRRPNGGKPPSGASTLPPPPPPPKRELASITQNLANVRRVVRRTLNGGSLPPPPPPPGRPALQRTPLVSTSPPTGKERGIEQGGGRKGEAYAVEEAYSAPSGLSSKDVQGNKTQRRKEDEKTEILGIMGTAQQRLSGQRASRVRALNKESAIEEASSELPCQTESREFLPYGGRQSSSSPPLDSMSPPLPSALAGTSPAARRTLYKSSGRSLGDMLAQQECDEGRKPSKVQAHRFFKKGKSKQ